ncbi:MAG: hypothetical protein HQK78_17795 [Desulfobacterales bacterium]|nr:hypothetical protein [Desulfobacterales bacterium]
MSGQQSSIVSEKNMKKIIMALSITVAIETICLAILFYNYKIYNISALIALSLNKALPYVIYSVVIITFLFFIILFYEYKWSKKYIKKIKQNAENIEDNAIQIKKDWEAKYNNVEKEVEQKYANFKEYFLFEQNTEKNKYKQKCDEELEHYKKIYDEKLQKLEKKDKAKNTDIVNLIKKINILEYDSINAQLKGSLKLTETNQKKIIKRLKKNYPRWDINVIFDKIKTETTK